MLDLDPIEARADAATVGPWAYDFEPRGRDVAYVVIHPASTASIAEDAIEEDAEFIAHAREDFPALIAEVRRLRRGES